MRRVVSSTFRRVRHALADRRAVSAMLLGLAMPMLVGTAAMGVDLGLVMTARSALQANANAAAMAGAQAWTASGGSLSSAETTAQDWPTNHPVAGVMNVSAAVSSSCDSATSGLPSCTSATPNVLRVSMTGTVNTYMLHMFGIDTLSVTTTASAAKGGGAAAPLNVIFVIDATGSMSSERDDSGCDVPNVDEPTKFQCALYGVQKVMKQLTLAGDMVGLMVFPGTQGSATNQTWTPTCSSSDDKGDDEGGGSSSNPVVPYGTADIAYQIANTKGTANSDLDSGFISNGKLDHSDPLVKAVGDYTTSPALQPCLRAKGGEGTYYAEVLQKAAAVLTAQTGANQNVIVLLSDGGANATSKDFASGLWTTDGPKQCNQAVQAAYDATSLHNIAIYSIAYDASSSDCPSYSAQTSSDDHSDDSSGNSSNGSIPDTNSVSASTTAGIPLGATWTPCLAMQAIASDASHFYSTSDDCKLGEDANKTTNVASAFTQVATSLSKPRLVMR